MRTARNTTFTQRLADSWCFHLVLEPICISKREACRHRGRKCNPSQCNWCITLVVGMGAENLIWALLVIAWLFGKSPGRLEHDMRVLWRATARKNMWKLEWREIQYQELCLQLMLELKSRPKPIYFPRTFTTTVGKNTRLRSVTMLHSAALS